MSASQPPPVENSLVAYKSRPARVLKVADNKLEIELEGGKTQRVRYKDVVLLHRGPLSNLAALKPQSGEVEEAWELLAGESTNLADLAELVFGRYTPPTAWATWQLIMDGLYFSGTPDKLQVGLPEEVVKEQEARTTKATEKREWLAFIGRLQEGSVSPQHSSRLSEVERLAYGKSDRSRVLRALGRQETPENAHSLLLKVGYWKDSTNPYPTRMGLASEPPNLEWSTLPDEDRLDLTHLSAFAIDDTGNKDPDDAISLDGDNVWVHVADVAAQLDPDSDLDLEARGRGATVYLPEGNIPMLPVEAIDTLGLGLSDISPAFSFKLALGEQGEIAGVEVTPSWVRVTRLTYGEVEKHIADAPFSQLRRLAASSRERRKANGAVEIRLPEVAIQIVQDKVLIRELPPYESRALVTEFMLMAGEAAARFASEHNIPFPFATQALPDLSITRPRGPAEMFAYRKRLKRSQMKSAAGLHAGLGLQGYTQVTSPLRRYLDLVAHQQLRAFIRGDPTLSKQALMMRVGATEAVIHKARRLERLSSRHWTLVHLQRNPHWRGQGIVVEQRGPLATVLIPTLGLDATVSRGRELELNSEIDLGVEGVDLPRLAAQFRSLD
jgi:exoribonuclease-2